MDAVFHFATKPEHNRVDDHHNHHANRHAADAQKRDSTRQQVAPYQQQFIHSFPVPSIGLCAFKRDSTTPLCTSKKAPLYNTTKHRRDAIGILGKKRGFYVRIRSVIKKRALVDDVLLLITCLMRAEIIRPPFASPNKFRSRFPTLGNGQGWGSWEYLTVVKHHLCIRKNFGMALSHGFHPKM